MDNVSSQIYLRIVLANTIHILTSFWYGTLCPGLDS